jgi:hypothetical protein
MQRLVRVPLPRAGGFGYGMKFPPLTSMIEPVQ